MTNKINLLDYNHAKLLDFCNIIGEKPFRAQQLLKWIHQSNLCDFTKMTNISKKLCAQLLIMAEIRLPEILTTEMSHDGTCKWLMKFSCGNSVETVFIPEGKRGTLCVSSQIGCGLNCSFCATGKQGFNRNLTTGEIIAQVWLATQTLAQNNQYKVTNIVMMGMGEPLLNFDNVITAMDIMMDDCAYGLSKYRVTLSTAGVIPEMLKLKEQSSVALAVSLHAPNDELRDLLVPINKKYNLTQLMHTCKNYFPVGSKRKITFEYVMLKGINDQLKYAEQLAKLLYNVPAKVNLIPFNPFALTQYERSDPETIYAFREFLLKTGINTTTRKTRGDDIQAACGQLAGEFIDRTTRSIKWLNRNLRSSTA